MERVASVLTNAQNYLVDPIVQKASHNAQHRKSEWDDTVQHATVDVISCHGQLQTLLQQLTTHGMGKSAFHVFRTVGEGLAWHLWNDPATEDKIVSHHNILPSRVCLRAFYNMCQSRLEFSFWFRKYLLVSFPTLEKIFWPPHYLM